MLSGIINPMNPPIPVKLPTGIVEKDLCTSLENKRDIWVVLYNQEKNEVEAHPIKSAFPKDEDEIGTAAYVYIRLHKLVNYNLVYTSKKGAMNKVSILNKLIQEGN